MATLSVQRKNDRITMAKCLDQIAMQHGATIESKERDREISLNITLSNVYVFISLNGTMPKDHGFLGHWNSKARFCPSFGADIGGTVNQYHGCKATTYRDDFDAFCGCIDRGFECVASEVAFAD